MDKKFLTNVQRRFSHENTVFSTNSAKKREYLYSTIINFDQYFVSHKRLIQNESQIQK